jgi:hypothetical protein
MIKSRKAFKVPIHVRTYKHVIDRIIHRRTNAVRSDKQINMQYPLSPYTFVLTDKQKSCVKHLENKMRNVNSLPVEVISRSAVCNHEALTEFSFFTGMKYYYRNIYRNIRWDTYAKKRKRIKPSA